MTRLVPYADVNRQREYQRQWLGERRAKAVTDRGGACEQCGSADRLEFHHRDPSAKTSHRIWSWSWPRMQAELAKCDLLCATCHQAYTREFGTGQSPATAEERVWVCGCTSRTSYWSRHSHVARAKGGSRCSSCLGELFGATNGVALVST